MDCTLASGNSNSDLTGTLFSPWLYLRGCIDAGPGLADHPDMGLFRPDCEENQKSNAADSSQTKGDSMLWTICVVLVVLWFLGVVTAYTMGVLIHILLVIAIITVLVNVIQGRRAV